jgi:hypothetical protein
VDDLARGVAREDGLAPDELARSIRHGEAKLVDAIDRVQSGINAIGWMFALAERAARKYGARAISIVRTAARAIADLLDQALERRERNLSLDIGGLRVTPSPYLSQLATMAANVAVDIGSSLLRSQLGALGIGDDVFNVIGQESNKQGMTLGPLAHPPKLPTFASRSLPERRRSVTTHHLIDHKRLRESRELASEWRLLRAKIRHVVECTCALGEPDRRRQDRDVELLLELARHVE